MHISLCHYCFALQTDFHVARRFFGGAKVEMRTVKIENITLEC